MSAARAKRSSEFMAFNFVVQERYVTLDQCYSSAIQRTARIQSSNQNVYQQAKLISYTSYISPFPHEVSLLYTHPDKHNPFQNTNPQY